MSRHVEVESVNIKIGDQRVTVTPEELRDLIAAARELLPEPKPRSPWLDLLNKPDKWPDQLGAHTIAEDIYHRTLSAPCPPAPQVTCQSGSSLNTSGT